MKATHYTKETILNLGVYDRNFPHFKAGDTIIVTTKVKEVVSTVKKEGVKVQRNQSFEGVVLAVKHGNGIAKTFTVRKIMDGISIERIFPYYSPQVLDIQLKEEGDVRRSKLYYLRDRFGKKSEVKRKKKIKIVAQPNKNQAKQSDELGTLEAQSQLTAASSVTNAASL